MNTNMRLITLIFLLVAPSFGWAEKFYSGTHKEKIFEIMTNGEIIWEYKYEGDPMRLISFKKALYLCHINENSGGGYFQIVCKDTNF